MSPCAILKQTPEAMGPGVYTELDIQGMTWSSRQQPGHAPLIQHPGAASACKSVARLLACSDGWEENKNLLTDTVMKLMSSIGHKTVSMDAAPSESDQSSEPEREPHNISAPDPADVPRSVLATVEFRKRVSFVQADACDQPAWYERKNQVANSPDYSVLDECARQDQKKELRKRKRKSSSLITMAWKAQQQEQQMQVLQQTWQHVDERIAHAHVASMEPEPRQFKEQFCTSCGSAVQRHFKFCRFCGTASPSFETLSSLTLSQLLSARWEGVGGTSVGMSSDPVLQGAGCLYSEFRGWIPRPTNSGPLPR